MVREGEHTAVNNCHAGPSKVLVEIPYPENSSGEGLPYAPEDWPYPGDKWRWKVGSRSTAAGYWSDKYLYPPPSCQPSTGKKLMFPSRPTLEDYIRVEFPATDFNAFLSSFLWKVRCSADTPLKEKKHQFRRNKDIKEHSGVGPTISDGGCKVGNETCNLNQKERDYSLPAKVCDVCCSEDEFCRDCCCILCGKSIDWSYRGYSFIRCEAKLDDSHICGHVAHVDCGVRCYLAGTVGGSISLDVQYYCRRCDSKIDLISHVTKLVQTCESLGTEDHQSLDSQDHISKILNLGFCLLRGSEKATSRNLWNRIELVMAKVKDRCRLSGVEKVEDNIPYFKCRSQPANEVIVLD